DAVAAAEKDTKTRARKRRKKKGKGISYETESAGDIEKGTQDEFESDTDTVVVHTFHEPMLQDRSSKDSS
ncbi:hypothetical protein V1520DRAFT_109799, partial [Lipomyces starkeyi]